MWEFESFIYFAFFMGLLSAASLPMGTLTTLVWQPSDRSLAWLMAFGAGALLSAVTIDLFSPAMQDGLFLEVSIGAIIGSLIYLLLNKILNERGAFLRKTATAIQFLRRQQRAQEMAFLGSLNRLSFFKDLSTEDKQALLQEIKICSYPAGKVFYHHGDAHNMFYLIQRGEVSLQDPKMGLKTIIGLDEQDAFGRMAFFTSQANATMAVARTDVSVWQLSRDRFNALLERSPTFRKKLIEYYQSDQGLNSEMVHYLQTRHGFSETAAKSKLSQIIRQIETEHQLSPSVSQEANPALALERLKNTQRFSVLAKISPLLYPEVARMMQFRRLKAGEALFKKGGAGDRLYLLESGRVSLIDPAQKREVPVSLEPGAFFGVGAFCVGGVKASTALAETDIEYWIITKEDFEALLFQHHTLKAQFETFLRSENIAKYLQTEQRIPALQAEKWIRQSVKSLVPGKMPNLNEYNLKPKQHTAAYLAIWLGIFLDGIPESLVIGAHVSSEALLSMSLIAGLFLSNYPEALSSSASMRNQGIRFSTVLAAWGSLMVLTAVGAAIGSVVFVEASASTLAIISGIAAGAMLTVISETMLPEAYYKGGSVIGFVTLIGFIAALSFNPNVYLRFLGS